MSTETIQNTTTTPDYTAIKQKQQTAWGSGDYSKVGVTLQITGEQLCESMNLSSGQSVLDVAAGNGNVTLAAARRFCNVTSTDYVPSLLEQSKKRSIAEGFTVNYQQADAENLPFDDNSFDNVVSTFGVMFTPNQAQTASELVRVCKPGGKIGIANWTPDGLIGQLFKTLGGYIAPPPGVRSPALWGTDAFLQENFSIAASDISNTKRQFNFRYESVDHWLDIFGNYYGPVLKAFEALDADKGDALRSDIRNLLTSVNTATDGTVIAPSDYFETVITLKS
ncbi:MAG: class I SAM-dependent methyltransferase [Acidiferrobacterales bacterium]|nr:class I SAM-dependent methyltransferase [Acidiferrobacterales bacterium]